VAKQVHQRETNQGHDAGGISLPGLPMRCGAMMVLLSTLIVGCDGSGVDLYPVRGRVEFADGTPLTGGSVSFRSDQVAGGVTARGQIRPDGTFSLTTFTPDDGAVPGKHQALVVSMLLGDRETLDPSRTPQLDPRFSNYDTSGLEFDVSDESAKNDFKIVVEQRR
jgi:hypothetical protein